MHSNIDIPQDYIQLMQSTLTDPQQLAEFIDICKTPLKKSVRVNTLKISVEEFETLAQQYGWQLQPIPWCKEGFWIEADESKLALGNSAQHMNGLFYIQEASSMMPPVALFDGDAITEAQQPVLLDMAAAPGSKSTQLAALLRNQGGLVSNEISATRLKVLHHNLERCGVTNHAITHFDAKVFGEYCFESFDAVLLDAPCSGEGAIRKDEHAMQNWSLESTQEIAELQKTLIESAFYALKPGGNLVYSTCTLNQIENQQVAQHLLDTFDGNVEVVSLNHLFDTASKSLTDEGYLHVFPQHFDSEGFFVAKFVKTGSVTAPKQNKKRGKFPFQACSKKQVTEINAQLKSELNLTLPSSLSVWQRDKEIWLFPQSLEPMFEQIRFQRIGIKLAETHKKGYRWTGGAAVSLATSQTVDAIALDKDELSQWYQGQDIRPQGASASKGYVFVSFEGQVLGLGKWVSNRIKNGLARESVRDGIQF